MNDKLGLGFGRGQGSLELSEWAVCVDDGAF